VIDKEGLIILGVVWLVRVDRFLWEATQRALWEASHLLRGAHECASCVVNTVFKETWLPNGCDHH
jgi:hypothetical protein